MYACKQRFRFPHSQHPANYDFLLPYDELSRPLTHFLLPGHRDIKPENVLYASPALDSPVKLVDFGLASLHDPAQHAMRTVCGTPAYAGARPS